MKTVWKFPIPAHDDFTVEMPKDALILSLQTQKDQVCIWALVDPAQSTESRNFRIVGTGYAIEADERLRFIATIQICSGSLVLHVFERLNS